jgi:AAA ATPase domain
MPLASVLPSHRTTLLLEREAQVAALRALADGAQSGGGRFVVIEGTAGLGKTRLLAEGRAIADSAGMRVLAARGGELEGEFAYGIVRQLFEPLLAVVSPDLRAELLSGPAALIAPLLGTSQPAGSQEPAAECKGVTALKSCASPGSTGSGALQQPRGRPALLRGSC